MSGSNSDKLEKTKKQLQREIDRVENMLDDSLGKVKKEVFSADPRKQIQQNPLPAVGIAVLIGFLLSKKSFKKKNTSLKKTEVGSVVWKEIRRRALRIAMKKAGDYVEDLFADTSTPESED